MAPAQPRILPAEILRVIASFSSVPSLFTLCLSSRVAYASATPHLYKSLILAEPNAAYGAFRTLADRPLLAAYVRSLWVYTHSRLVQRPLPEGWWAALGEALARTTALTYILIQDPVALQPGAASVARFLGKLNTPTLREARLQIAWDAQYISAFVRRHPELMCLHVNGFVDSTIASDVDNTSTTGNTDAKQIVGTESSRESTIGVRILSIPLSAARYLVPYAPSLTHLQILCEPYHATNATLSKKSWSLLHALSPLPSALRSLHISEMPEEGMDENLWSLLRLCSFSLVHLGVIPLPFGNRQTVREILHALPALSSLEVNINTWHPTPPEYLSRAVCAELHAFRPSLTRIVFVFGRSRTLWTLEDPEIGQLDGALPWPVWAPEPRIDRTDMWREV